MADTVRQRILDAVVAEMRLIPGMTGARHDYPWDIFEQSLPHVWVYDLSEEPRPDEEHGIITSKINVGIEAVFSVGERGSLLREGNRILGLIQGQLGAAMTEENEANWRELRRLAEYFDETENDIQEVPNERDAFVGVVVTNWGGTYTRTFHDPTEPG